MKIVATVAFPLLLAIAATTQQNPSRVDEQTCADTITSGQLGAAAKVLGNLEVLSDTQGVDFCPYLSRVVNTVRRNWYVLIPERARAPLMESGKVVIEFRILPNGTVAGMKLVDPSGDVALDKAAWGGITASVPFADLPAEFTRPYLALRFRFFYNPTKGEIPSDHQNEKSEH